MTDTTVDIGGLARQLQEHHLAEASVPALPEVSAISKHLAETAAEAHYADYIRNGDRQRERTLSLARDAGFHRSETCPVPEPLTARSPEPVIWESVSQRHRWWADVAVQIASLTADETQWYHRQQQLAVVPPPIDLTRPRDADERAALAARLTAAQDILTAYDQVDALKSSIADSLRSLANHGFARRGSK